MDELAVLTAITAAAVRLTVPTLLAALGEVVAERAGVLNLGLEGMMITGAFISYAALSVTSSSFVSLVAGICAGGLLGVVMVLASVRKGGSQVVAGFAITIAGLGLAGFLNDRFRAALGQVDALPPFDPLGLSETPVLGPILFSQNVLFWFALIATIAIGVFLDRTRWGLEIRATGLDPWSAFSKGVPILRIRSAATIFASCMAGLGGAAISVGVLGSFGPGMTAGRGFVAIALVIVGRWNPTWVAGAALVFGAAEALQLRLQTLIDAPSQLLAALPWVVMIILLAVGGKSARVPRTLGKQVTIAR